jgi:hypothetical protein
MKSCPVTIPVLVIAVIGGVAAAVYLALNPLDTILELQVQDVVSQDWVWDTTIRLQGRVIRSHYQSDRGPITQRFSHLAPGEARLQVTSWTIAGAGA